MAMKLGAVSFTSYAPDEHDIPLAQKTVSVQPTYSGAKIFVWGTTITGQVAQIKWDMVDMPTWNALNTLYAAEGTLVWEPEAADSSGKRYEVVFSSLQGRLVGGQLFPFREDVVAKLTIVREVIG